MSSKTIVISGDFDPLHAGHLDLIEAAKAYGDVHVVLNADEKVVRSKGFFFQPQKDRKRIIEAFVSGVHCLSDEQGMASLLTDIKADYFGFGADGVSEADEVVSVCAECGVEPVLNLGGYKYNSSSEINSKSRVVTRWGHYDVLIDMPKLKVKILHVKAGKKLSLQKHGKRSEFFFMPNGEVRMNLPGVWHAPQAPADRSLTILEVQVGVSEEEDIERVSETALEYATEVARKIDLNR